MNETRTRSIVKHNQKTNKQNQIIQVVGQTGGDNYGGIPAIEITKEGTSDVGYMCGDDDGDDYIVDNPNASSARRRSTVTDISSYDQSPTERQQQQVRLQTLKKKKTHHTTKIKTFLFKKRKKFQLRDKQYKNKQFFQNSLTFNRN